MLRIGTASDASGSPEHREPNQEEVDHQTVLVEIGVQVDVDLVVVTVKPLGATVGKDQEVRSAELQVVLLDGDGPGLARIWHRCAAG